jgi:Exopolysaccharide synthesis, ExoD
MLPLALVSLLPGAGILAGILLRFPAVQMILGRESPSLPRFLGSWRVSTQHIAGLAALAVPLLERMEAVIHPRLPMPFEVTKRLIGFVVLLLAATLVSPVPLQPDYPGPRVRADFICLSRRGRSSAVHFPGGRSGVVVGDGSNRLGNVESDRSHREIMMGKLCRHGPQAVRRFLRLLAEAHQCTPASVQF